ncbi:hypothetical protein HK100_000590 [Physocladia obscura]|uniref:SH3 domain-containing protein n=1 Tax=Physocladia obscura TaxID=109957 RepID=A0AAD5T0Y0_9FUNG|nr:hypothetical protein HK100_000590 [Physocladia obscura]
MLNINLSNVTETSNSNKALLNIEIQTTASTSPNNSTATTNVPIPAIAGAIVGCTVFVAVGLLVLHSRQRKSRVVPDSIESPASIKDSCIRDQKYTTPVDTIAQMTATGIRLPQTTVDNSGITQPPKKPRIISSLPFKPSPMANSSTVYSPPDESSDGDNMISHKPLIIPRRTMSISTENPFGGGDACKRSIFSASRSQNNRRKPSILSPACTAPALVTAETLSPTRSVNNIVEKFMRHHQQNQQGSNILNSEVPPPLESLDSVNVSVESIASALSIDSDDIELEDKYEVQQPWVPQRFDELELFVGETVIVYQIFEDGWCDGRVEDTEETGAFPFACLKANLWPDNMFKNEVSQEPDSSEETSITSDLQRQRSIEEEHDTFGDFTSLQRKSNASSSSTHSNLSRISAQPYLTQDGSETAGTAKAKRFSGMLKNIDQLVQQEQEYQQQQQQDESEKKI